MILRQLVLQDYGPFAGRVTLDLSPSSDPPRRPITLIGALNGGGKTSVLDAMLLALHGKRARCAKRGGLTYPDFLRACIHEDADPDRGARIELEFDHATRERHSRVRVIRSWRVPGRTVAESLDVLVDGELDDAMSQTWEQRVEELIPVGLSNLFFFDGEQVRELAGLAQPPEDVQEAIRTLLGLELPSRLVKDLHVLLHRKERERLATLEQARVEELEASLSEHQRRLASTEAALAALRAREAEARQALEASRGRFIGQGGEHARRRAEIDEDVHRGQAEEHHARERLRQLAEGALPLAMLRPLLVRAVDHAEREVSGEEARRLVQQLTARDEAILRELVARGTPKKTLRWLEAHLSEDRQARAGAITRPPRLGATPGALARAQALLEGGLEGELGAARVACDALKDASDKVRSAKARLESAASPEDFQELADAVEGAASVVADLEREIARLDAELSGLADAQARLAEELSRTVKQQAASYLQHQEDERLVTAGNRVLEVMAKYQHRLKLRRLAELEHLITRHFRHLARKPDLVQHVQVGTETFGITLIDGEGRVVERRRLSAGEQQLLAVAFLWALAEASGRPLPVVIDTPLARMDSMHRSNLVEGYFPNVSHQTILLSTDVEIDKTQYDRLKRLDVIDRCYLIHHDDERRASTFRPGWFDGEAVT